MGNGDTCPNWKCFFSALLTNKCCQKSQYTKYLCTIFQTCRQLLGGLCPQTLTGTLSLTPLEDFCPTDHLICPPLEKILQVLVPACMVEKL